jgi:hypothetical protein
VESILELAGLQPEGESKSGFQFECGGGRIGVEAGGDRLTPDGGIAAWSHYLEPVGMVEDLAKRYPAERTSPNAHPGARCAAPFHAQGPAGREAICSPAFTLS